ncbi:MAG: ubiquinol-cytochrome c reductase iron-sulfur subunit [Burkholderiaceae bacterium]|nr:ubiquinol-cytochrome c reductase iron-sulfur subunit [Burkholderiaceae bacterium]
MSDIPAGSHPVDTSKRTWLIASGCAGAVGGIATLVPFVSSFQPSTTTKVAGAPVEVDISGLRTGEKMTVMWRGQPVWILKRTPEQIAGLSDPKHKAELADPDSGLNADEYTPPYARNDHRSIKPEVLITIGVCTHLGCTPIDHLQPGAQPSLPDDWIGGFLCPCHGSTYDLAARVYKNKPAPFNLKVPPHVYLSDTRLLIGDDKKA